MEISIDDLFIILGPNLSFVSHDESYIADEDLDESYDSTNVFNIFEHELQIKKKTKSKLKNYDLVKMLKKSKEEKTLKTMVKKIL